LLVTPLELYLDSDENIYYLRLRGIFKLWVDMNDDDIKIRASLFSFGVRFKPVERMSRMLDKRKERKKRKKSQMKLKGIMRIFTFAKDIVKSFNVRSFELVVDTGDDILNARLFPFFFLLSNKKRYLRINFEDVNRIRIVIENKLYRLAGAGMKFGYNAFIKDKLIKIFIR